MADTEDARDGVREDYENELRYHNARMSPPMAKNGQIARYIKLYDEPDEYTCDAVYYDRTTGAEVMRYDAADPANTNPFYGAESDLDVFARKGLDLNEMIDPVQAKVTDQELRGKVSTYNSYLDGDW